MFATLSTQPTLLHLAAQKFSDKKHRIAFHILMVLGATAILAASARIQVPMYPVPMTMQTFAVVLIGLLYGAKMGALTLLVYLAEGAIGLPVFANGGGWAYFVSQPSTGYLIGFVLAAAFAGYAADRGWDRHVLKLTAVALISHLIIFLLGVPWLYGFLSLAGSENASWDFALYNGFWVFGLGLILKSLLLVATMTASWQYLVSRQNTDQSDKH